MSEPRDLLAPAVDAMPMGVAIVDASRMEYVYANRAFAATAAVAEVEGRSNAQVWPLWADALDSIVREARSDRRWAEFDAVESGPDAAREGSIGFRAGPLGLADTPEEPWVVVIAEPRGHHGLDKAARSGPSARFESVLTVSEGAGVLVVTGDLDTASAPHFERVLRGALEATPDPLIVDLCGVSYMESLAFGSLIAAHGRAGDGRLAIACGRPEVMHLFEVAGLTQALRVADSVEGARRLLEA